MLIFFIKKLYLCLHCLFEAIVGDADMQKPIHRTPIKFKNDFTIIKKMRVRSLNKYCYLNGDLLTENNIADEHIIPNALGGHLRCPDLVCEEINNTLFARLDAQLSKSIELSQLIKFERERGDQPSITGTGADGFKYSVNNDKVGTLLSLEPFLYIDKEGNKFKKFPVSQEEEYIQSYLKKNPQSDRDDIEKKYKSIFEEKYQEMDFKNGLNIITNKEPFRAIAKIATNFSVLQNLGKSYFLDFIEFIKGSDDLSKIKLGYFYPKELLSYKFEQDEISHILYLKGSVKEKILYCYIELFNTHCFIVILNQNYSGPAFEKSYIWDLRKTKELQKHICLNLTKEYLMQRDYMFYDKVEADYTERLKRTNLICDLKIKFK